MKLGSLKIKKSLFLKKNCGANLIVKKSLFFKKFFFYFWLSKFFFLKDFNTYIFYMQWIFFNSFIFFDKIINLKKVKIISFFKINYFYFHYNWLAVEKFSISKLLRFNIKYLSKHLSFLKRFNKEFTLFFLELKKHVLNITIFCRNFIDYFSCKKIDNFLNLFVFMYKKINFIFLNPDYLIEKFNLFSKITKKIKFFYANFFFKNFFFLNRFYFGYQAFLNTSLYLHRYSLFTNTIVASNFNVLLLWNFNEFFFRTGYMPRNFLIQEFFIWGKENIFFWKGEPYYSYKLTYLENSTFTNLNYTNLNLYQFLTFKELKSFDTNFNFTLYLYIYKNFDWTIFFNNYFF